MEGTIIGRTEGTVSSAPPLSRREYTVAHQRVTSASNFVLPSRGVISANKGGCGTLELTGNFTDFIPFTSHGLSSIGFPTVFPLSFRFADFTSPPAKPPKKRKRHLPGDWTSYQNPYYPHIEAATAVGENPVLHTLFGSVARNSTRDEDVPLSSSFSLTAIALSLSFL